MVLRSASSAHVLTAEAELTLVPAGRLGRVLVAQRQSRHLSLKQMARRSARRFDAVDLAEFESGLREASDEELQLLRSMYAPEGARVLPQRMHLVLDLDNRVVRAGELEAKLKRRTVNAATNSPTKVLHRYLELVYLLRHQRPGTAVPMRDADVQTLAAALDLTQHDIEQRLTGLMTEGDWSDRSLQRKVILPVAGILVAATSMGQLVLEPDDAGQNGALGGSPDSVPTIGVVDVMGEAAPVGTRPTAADGQARRDPSTTAIEWRAQAAGHHDHDHDHETTASDSETARGVVGANDHNVAIGAEALSLISYDWQRMLPDWDIRFAAGREGYLGGTFPHEKRIELYIRAGQEPKDVAITLAHELGHAVDVTMNDPADRAAWRDARGLDDRAWFGEAGATDYDTPAGDFAESFAVWQIDDSDFRSSLGASPTAAQIHLLESLSS